MTKVEEPISAQGGLGLEPQPLGRLLCVMPSIPLGGMERAVLRVTTALMSRGFDTHFLLDAQWGTEVQKAVAATGASWSGMPFVASFSRPRTWHEARLAARSFLRSAGEIVRASEAFAPRQLLATGLNNAFMARRIARRCDIRSVFRVGNPPGVSRWKAKMLIDRRLWRQVYADYDALVCNSDYTAERVAGIVGSDRRIHVIRNFMPEGNDRRPRDAPQLDRSNINVVYLGQVSKAKGVDVLLEAALLVIAAGDNVVFTVAGPDVWQDPFGDELRRRISAAGATKRILVTGAIADVPGLLSQADIHVCPSVSAGESFPNVVLDAKQAGVPSVVFPTAGLPEAIEHGIDGIVTKECSAPALRDALLALCRDPEHRRRLGEGAVRSRHRHKPDALTEAWVRVFSRDP